jgi:putative flippase GtrA
MLPFLIPLMLFNRQSISKFLKSAKFRYLAAGAWNTVFGYFIGVILYLFLSPHAHLVMIAIISNVIAITMSFMTYKLIVFRTPGNWLLEYLRCYIVYGFNAILGIFFLWLFVNVIGLNIWIAQGISIVVTVIISFFLHQRFTFRPSSSR